MELKVTGQSLIKARIDVLKLRENLKNLEPYEAIKKSIEIIEKTIPIKKEKMIDVIYSEVNWGTFFMIMEKFPNREFMDLRFFPVSYKDMPVATKDKADFDKGEFHLKVSKESGTDFMILSGNMMKDPDAWIDAFLGGRFFNSLSDWVIEVDTD